MKQRKNKPPAGLQQPRGDGNKWPDFGHIHQGHRANHAIESPLAKRQELLFVGAITDVEFNSAGIVG